MTSDDFSSKLQDLKIKESQDINILLLGETGVGKSTFINSIANYLHFKSFKKAAKAEELLVLIPSVITVTNQNFEQVTLTIGSDNNEYQEIGAAATQDVKTYVFPIGDGKIRLRLIDSPGMGDPRGIEQDDVNCENILAYLSQLKELHAICFLFKPTNTRLTVLFEYCVKQILSRLEKSASNNIIFIFTNTRGTNYSPGDTMPCLTTVINDIKAKPPHVEIPLKGNTFSVDNEAFRFLVAMKKGITFDQDVQMRFIESWNCSSKACWSLISYIVGDTSHDPLKPHQLLNTISINEARRIIVQLSQPLADISQLIYDNIRILERHKRNLNVENQSLDELKKKLYIPIIKLEVTQLTQPVTVCTSPKCADVVKVGEVHKWHYRQRCHDPCYLRTVTKEIVGDTNLIHCTAMGGTRNCQRCTCDFSVHMHVYYLTKTVDDKVVDDVVRNNITRKEEALSESRRLMGEIDRRKTELEQERDIIVKSTAQFAHFLQHNAISPFNDSYKAYIEYLITREKSLGRNGDPEVINNLEQLIRQYEGIKAAFETSLTLSQQFGLNAVVTSTVTAKSVLDTIKQLYQLKHNGKKIHELFKKQKSSRSSEYDKSCEYVHPKSSNMSQSDTTKPKKEKKKDGKTTDDDRKKKGGKSTDDERKHHKGSYVNNPNQNQRPRFQNYNQHYSHQPPNPGNIQRRDPPPPYPGHDTRNYQRQGSKPYSGEDEERNVIVKVELTQPSSKQPKAPKNPNYQHQNQEPYYGQPDYSYNGPHQGPYQGGPYQGPPQGPYYGGPQFSGPPGGFYQGPQYHGPPHGQYYGPPAGQFQGPYHGPPQGQFQGPQGQFQGAYQRRSQPNRGRHQFNKRGGTSRGRSKSKDGKDKKSGNEKSGRSSSSDSSD